MKSGVCGNRGISKKEFAKAGNSHLPHPSPGLNLRFKLVSNTHILSPAPHDKEAIKSVGSMGRTIGIAVGCAAAYIVLVVGLMIYCKGRRARQNKKEEVMAPECENRKFKSVVFELHLPCLFFLA